MSTTFAWKHEYDVKLWHHKQRTPNKNDRHLPLNEPPPWKFSAYATASYTCYLTEERVSNLSDLSLNKHEQDQVVTTESGKEIKADLIIPCTGTKLNNDFFKDMLREYDLRLCC